MDYKEFYEEGDMGGGDIKFFFGHMEQVDPRQTRGHKKTYYCNTCLITLNSEVTMISHRKGVGHMKKNLALEEKLRNQGQAIQKPEIIPIKNPEPSRRKVPVRLQEKIQELSDPVVGLDFIQEFIAVSDSEMEPHYECSLCGNMGQANGMLAHLMGRGHRQEFVSKLYGLNHNTVDMSQAALRKKAADHDENVSGFADRIKTRYSDEEYPWPSGKEPWSILKGGTGIVPDAARRNYGNNLKSEASSSNSYVSSEKEGSSSKGLLANKQSCVLPRVESINKPTSSHDCMKMMEVGKMMLMTAAEYPGSGIKHKEKALLETCLAAVALKMSGRNTNLSVRSSKLLPDKEIGISHVLRSTSSSSGSKSRSSGYRSGICKGSRSPSMKRTRSPSSSVISYNARSPPSRRWSTRSPNSRESDSRSREKVSSKMSRHDGKRRKRDYEGGYGDR